MPQIHLGNNGNDADLVFVHMFSPNIEDLSQRNNYLAVLEAAQKLTDEKGIDLTLNSETIKRLLLAPSKEELKHIGEKRGKKGKIVGDILACLFLMDHYKLNPSMKKAVAFISEFYKSINDDEGGKIDASQRHLRSVWASFNSVSHFWAARVLNEAYPYMTEGRSVYDPEDFKIFLGVSKTLERFGVENKKPRPADENWLPADKIWTLPSTIAPLKFVPTRKPTRLIAFVKNYKSQPL